MKKKLYSVVALVMVLVMSIPVVTNANEPFKFTTYECVSDIYTEGDWKDKAIECAFLCTNEQYEYYVRAMETLPISLNEYDYYFAWVNGSTFGICGIKTNDYGCLFYYDAILPSSLDYSSAELFERLNNNHKSKIDGNDYAYVTSNVCNTIDAVCTGTYTTWKLNCTTLNSEWENAANNEEIPIYANSTEKRGLLFATGVIVATNMDLYSNYEFGVVIPKSEDVWRPEHRSMSYDEVIEATKKLTILNIELPYYDGENILGGTPTYDLTRGFDSFTIEKINHPDAIGGSGALLNWSLAPDTLENIDPNWKVRMNYTVSYSILDVTDGFLLDNTEFDGDIFYETVDIDIETFVKQNGSYMYTLDNAFETGLTPFTLNLMLEYVSDNDGYYTFSSSFLGDQLIPYVEENLFTFRLDGVYEFQFIDVQVEIQLYNEVENLYSNSAGGHVELVSGKNSSWVNEISEDGTSQSIKPDSQTSGNNYYNVVTETDSNGNAYYNYYYYDTTNNTVTPSIGNFDTLNLVHTFANPLQINGISGSGGSISSNSSGGDRDNINVTIEDDDYTDTALREDLRDGFGLLDNMDTEKNADGFLQMAAGFFEHLDGDLDDMLVFGMSSVIAISILRSIFRR